VSESVEKFQNWESGSRETFFNKNLPQQSLFVLNQTSKKIRDANDHQILSSHL